MHNLNQCLIITHFLLPSSMQEENWWLFKTVMKSHLCLFKMGTSSNYQIHKSFIINYAYVWWFNTIIYYVDVQEQYKFSY